ncbi:hypothetical protein [Streptomyces sp. NPDC048340]|uniref:hypothetical protein n=1 Tax=Streptomyces sp. NPDC048340 TaxID=3365537 RepID=UPI0037110807
MLPELRWNSAFKAADVVDARLLGVLRHDLHLLVQPEQLVEVGLGDAHPLIEGLEAGIVVQRTCGGGVEHHAVVEAGRHRGVEMEDGLVRLTAGDGHDTEVPVGGGDEPGAVGAERGGARDDVLEACDGVGGGRGGNVSPRRHRGEAVGHERHQ